MTQLNLIALTKIERYSLSRLQLAINTVEELAPLERKKSTARRRKQLSWACAAFRVHCSKLDFPLPPLSTTYDEEQYLHYARLVADQMQEFCQSKGDR